MVADRVAALDAVVNADGVMLTDPERGLEDAMLAARQLWRDAVDAWGRDQGLDHLSTWRRIPARSPYWP